MKQYKVVIVAVAFVTAPDEETARAMARQDLPQVFGYDEPIQVEEVKKPE